MVRGNITRSLAAAALSVALMAGCASTLPSGQSPRIRPAASTQRISSLNSSWPGGKCKLLDDTIHFSDGKRSSSFHLDAKTSRPSGILCSEEHTVVIDSHYVVVGLGAESVLSGREMLGSVDGSFVPANSFTVNIDPVREEGLRTASISGSMLELRTEKGRSWTISLSNPSEGWNIY